MEKPQSDSSAFAPLRLTSHQAILAAARALFLETGYDGVTMNLIAAKAGVARRTVYNRFDGKEEIFRAVFAEEWARLRTDDLDDLSADGDPATTLFEAGRTAIRFLNRPDYVALVRMLFAESRHHPWLRVEFARVGGVVPFRYIVEYLVSLSNRNVIACPDPELAAKQFLGMILQPLHWPVVVGNMATDELPDIDKTVEEAVRTFMARYAVVPHVNPLSVQSSTS